MPMTSYESVLALVTETQSSASRHQRDVNWATDANVVGVSRDHDGHVEVFLTGSPLHPTSATVAEAIEFHTWHRDGAPSFDANRLLLPAVGYYDQVAAFICTELLRNGADVSLSLALAQTEPIIELAIERLRLSTQVIVGLAGELLVLSALVHRAADAQVASIVRSWSGWKRSSRDFVVGTAGIEVKTTTGGTSSHPVEGVHQVEANDGNAGGPKESNLYLISVGLEPGASSGDVFTIPQLVDRIVQRLSNSGTGNAVNTLLAHIKEYGAVSGDGYDHASQATDPAYATPFLQKFLRAYDMSDPGVRVLRRGDLSEHHHIDAGSVQFRIELPLIVSATNPISGANQVADAILR